MKVQKIYKVSFLHQGNVYEIYAKNVAQSSMMGFIEVSEFVFGEHTSMVVDPTEEKIKNEFSNVDTSLIPMHAIFRIDVVEKEGNPKMTKLSDGANISHFPSPIHNQNN